MPSGYSGTPLYRKLGIKEDSLIRVINKPEVYDNLLCDMPYDRNEVDDLSVPKDLIHYFIKESEELETELPELRSEIKQNGIIWVSWPKKASKVPTDVTEDVIRNFALLIKLVDVKVCAVNEIWSGLKLVIPVKYRK